MTKEVKVLTSIAVLVIVGGFLLFLNENPSDYRNENIYSVDENHSEELVRDWSYQTGNSDAEVTLVEFGDFQCPACKSAHPTVKSVISQYSQEELNFVFRNFPLSIHQNAQEASRTAEAAKEQGKFAEMMDMLFERQNEWSDLNDPDQTFTRYAEELDLNAEKFISDYESDEIHERVQTDVADGISLQVTGTPTFFLNGQKYTGSSLSQDIDKLLEQDQE